MRFYELMTKNDKYDKCYLGKTTGKNDQDF